jgi:hypothetical protein
MTTSPVKYPREEFSTIGDFSLRRILWKIFNQGKVEVPTAGDTVVTEQTYNQNAGQGTSTDFSRKDHTHGTPPHDTLADLTDTLIVSPAETEVLTYTDAKWQNKPATGGGLPTGAKILFNSKEEIPTDYSLVGMLANWLPCYRPYDATQPEVTVTGVYNPGTLKTTITASHSSFQGSDVGEQLIIEDIGTFTVSDYYTQISIRVDGNATCTNKKFRIAGRIIDRCYFTEGAGRRAFELYNGKVVIIGGITNYFPDYENLYEWWKVEFDTPDCNVVQRGEDKVWYYDKYTPPYWFSEPFFAKLEFACASRKISWDAVNLRWNVSGIAAGGYYVDPDGFLTPTKTVYLYNPYDAEGHFWKKTGGNPISPVIDLPVELAPAFGGVIYDKNDAEEKFVVCGYYDTFKVYVGNGRETWENITLPTGFEGNLRRWATGFSLADAEGHKRFYIAYGTNGGWDVGARTVWRLGQYYKGELGWIWEWTRMADSPDIGRAYPISYVNEDENYAVVGAGYNITRGTLGSFYKFYPPTVGSPYGRWEQMSDYPGIGASNAAGVAANTYTSATTVSKSEGFIIAGDVETVGSLTRLAAIFKQVNLFVARKE